MRCRLRGVWGTVTMGAFWRSLLFPPLVVYSGHVWPEDIRWSTPRVGPDGALVEYDVSRCVECGYTPEQPDWRWYYGSS